MQCLKNLIGIRGCGADAPDSGIWLNDYPGVSIKSLEGITNEEKATFIETWRAIERRAIRRLQSAVISELSRRYRLIRSIESITFSKEPDTVSNQTAPANEYRGIRLYYSDITGSSLLSLHVQDISIYAKQAAQTDIIIADAEYGTILWQSNVMLNAGWNKIYVGIDFEQDSLFIGYDAAGISSPFTPITTDSVSGCAECFTCNRCSLYIAGAKRSYNGATVDVGNTFGVIGTFSLRCSYDAFICSNKQLFANALAYIALVEVMNERLHSDRINRYTTVDLNKARELRDEYMQMFQQELSDVISGIDISEQDCCIECDALIRTVEYVP
jgi:hypothetical protein